ncbi:uncharacterized protein VTP21DRAFT_3889 [Calcarisporiella thermophila]|uniref:uncharacterized protein n=1 Tax=Calcarisporiella thermophila TaxID=911321 RepID=UPI0037437C64
MPSLDHNLTLRVPFPTGREATIAKQALEVDRELRADQVKRTIHVDGSKLVVSFDCDTVKNLRVSVNSFLEFLKLVAQTMDEFAEE